MIEDPAEVARQAKLREEENWCFRSFLKAVCGWSDARLNRVAAQLAREAAAQINCTDCGACCRENIVPLTDEDIDRLAGGVRLPVLDFRRRHVKSFDTDPQAMDAHPCEFLDGRRCSVYESRPQACRDYPYLDGDVRSRMIMILERAGTCPIVFEQLERLKDETRFRRIYPRP